MTTAAAGALACAGIIAAGPASAADKLSVGVGGYMQQWFGFADRDDDGVDGGWAAQSDSEIHFKGSLEADSGLKFTVHVELEGDRGSNAIDESYARVSGEFGQIEFGARDHAMVRMHSGISDVGIGLTAGDTQKWIPGFYLDTYGHAIGNARKLNYITPRVSGVQVGVSYAPDDTAQDANTGAPMDNEKAGWGAAVNFKQDVGDMAVTFSLGHKSTDTAGAKVEYMSAMAPATGAGGAMDPRLSQAQHAMYKKAWETLEYATQNVDKNKLEGLTGADDATRASNLAMIVNDGLMGRSKIMGATSSMTKGDASTYTNAGVGVGFGAFKFNVAYATVDGGAYTAKAMPVKMTAQEMFTHAAALATATGRTVIAVDAGGNTVADGEDDAVAIVDPGNTGNFGGTGATATTEESATNNDPMNETWMTSKIVEDESKNYDVWGVSVTYTDGPMAVSLGHMAHEDDAGGERTATMFSASYSLAPGVAWKSSVFTVEDTTSHKNVTGGKNEGTGFVTGITLGF